MSIQKYLSEACEGDLDRYGDNFRGVGYTKSADDAARCYAVMLGVVRPSAQPVTLVDLGCGLAHLLDHQQAHGPHNVQYTGVDLSDKYLATARKRQPQATLLQADVRNNPATLPVSDYVVMNGLFNYRGEYSQAEMWQYFTELVGVAWSRCNEGIAFNVMTKLVDWEREDLFHVGFDAMTQFVTKNLGRHFVIRQDYGMYEYTTYVYKNRQPS